MKVSFGVVLRPDKKLSSEITGLLRDISAKYKVNKAFKDEKGPHISFVYLDRKIELTTATRLTYELAKACSKIRPFKVRIKGVGYFMKRYKVGHPSSESTNVNYVVYLKVVKSKELSSLSKIISLKTNELNRARFSSFSPHISLARNDVTKETFLKILGEYRNFTFDRKFRVYAVEAGIRRQRKDHWKFKKLILRG